MRKLLYALATLVGVGLVWRVLSRRAQLPCPWWLSILVENPLMDLGAAADTVLEQAGVGPGMAVLDVGCGPGRVALAAAGRVGPAGRVLAVDVQPRMLATCRRRAAERGLTNLETLLAGAGTGALAERDAFDAAFMITVLGEIPNRAAALAEVHRALRPGGVLSISELLPDPHFQSQRTVRHLAGAVGFEVGERFGYPGAYTLHLRKPAG